MDYQFTLIAMIHDAQNWKAGHELIFFDPLHGEGLPHRLCRVVLLHLEKQRMPYQINDIQRLINTAMLAVRANLEEENTAPIPRTKLAHFIRSCREKLRRQFDATIKGIGRNEEVEAIDTSLAAGQSVGGQSEGTGGRGRKAVSKRKRPTKKEMANRQRAISYAAAEIELHYSRLPTVAEVVEKTKLPEQQIYDSHAYKEGKIAKASAKSTTEMSGGSVVGSEHYSERSEQHGRSKTRSKSDQARLDALIDLSKEDNESDPSPLE